MVELVEECLEIEERKTHDNTKAKAGDWWKKFANTPKVEVLKKMAKRLFKNEKFHEVLCFLMLFEGVDEEEKLQELMKLQSEENSSVKLSAQN